jgi:hypothetical protein
VLNVCHEDIWGSGGILPPFLTSALDGDEWSASRPGRFTLGERAPGTSWTGGWVSLRAGPDLVEKRKMLTLPGIEPRPPSLYPVAIPIELSHYESVQKCKFLSSPIPLSPTVVESQHPTVFESDMLPLNPVSLSLWQKKIKNKNYGNSSKFTSYTLKP